MISEFDLRQIHQMDNLVRSLQERAITVNSFITNQWTLVDLLETVDTGWKNQIFKSVNQIEDIYANAAAEGREQMSQSEIKMIDSILSEIARQIKEITSAK